MAANSLYEITHSNPEISTLGAWILEPSCPLAETIEIKNQRFDTQKIAKEVLTWVKNDKTNRERIIEKYTFLERDQYLSLDSFGEFKGFKVKENDLLLKTGTKLVIPEAKVDRFSLLTEGITVASVDEGTFKAQKLAELEADAGYVSISKPNKGNIQLGELKSIVPQITVWMWCRALSTDKDMKGQIIDLTPFVQKMSTSVTKNGGNFQLTLAPLVCEYTEGRWLLKKSSIKQAISATSGQKEYFAQENLFKLSEDKLVRNQFLFHRVINSNDLIFIRYETLKMEEKQRYEDALNFYINKSNLPGRVYDMIGLVDNNSFSLNPEGTDVNIQIAGRDLSKLFIDDGAYFYALEQSQGKANYAGGSTTKDPLSQRVFFEQGLQMAYVSLYFFNPIQKILQFIIQQLSTISIVPDDLFEAYGSDRNISYLSTPNNKLKAQNDLQEKEAKQLIKYIRLVNQIVVPKIEKDSFLLEEARMTSIIYQDLKRFLLGLRSGTPPYRLTENNKTTGWRAHRFDTQIALNDTLPLSFTNRLKIKDKGILLQEDPNIYKLIGLIDQVIDKEKSTKKVIDKSTEKLASGIWQIVDLVIDKSISNRRVVDASIGSSKGSLLNFVRKACQEPFVEFIMDTYGDRYFLTARRPPYNREGITTLLEGQVESETTKKIVALTVDIDEIDVLQEKLSFDDTEAYSWYRFTPQGSFLGSNENYSTAYIPALYFPEYAEIWGSRPLEVNSNYFTYLPLDQQPTQLSEVEKQAFVDLKYLVDSNAYLPFARKGTIVINRDRRMKVGNLVRYKPTGEIFLIDGVSHQHSVGESSIDATTTLQVSRGLVEQLIYGVLINDEQGNRQLVSYFNIITTDLDFSLKDSVRKREVQKKNPNYKPSDNTLIIEKHEEETDGGFKLSNNINVAIGRLEPSSREKFTQFAFAAMEKGYSLIVANPTGPHTSRRTAATQIKLILKHRNTGWYSADAIRAAERGDTQYMQRFPHVRGIAIDLNLRHNRSGKTYTSKSSIGDWRLTGIPQLASKYGLRWGGGFADPVHFEYVGNAKVQAQQGVEEEFITEVIEEKIKIVDQSKVLKNFKVNKAVMNFFLQQKQFNYSNVTVNRIQPFNVKNNNELYQINLKEVNITS